MGSLVVPSGGGLNPRPTIEEHITNRNFGTNTSKHNTPNVLFKYEGSSPTISSNQKSVTIPPISLEWSNADGLLLSDYGIYISLITATVNSGNMVWSSIDNTLTGSIQINDTIKNFSLSISTATAGSAIYINLNNANPITIGSADTNLGNWGILKKVKLVTNQTVTITGSSYNTIVSATKPQISVSYESIIE